MVPSTCQPQTLPDTATLRLVARSIAVLHAPDPELILVDIEADRYEIGYPVVT